MLISTIQPNSSYLAVSYVAETQPPAGSSTQSRHRITTKEGYEAQLRGYNYIEVFESFAKREENIWVDFAMRGFDFTKMAKLYSGADRTIAVLDKPDTIALRHLLSILQLSVTADVNSLEDVQRVPRLVCELEAWYDCIRHRRPYSYWCRAWTLQEVLYSKDIEYVDASQVGEYSFIIARTSDILENVHIMYRKAITFDRTYNIVQPDTAIKWIMAIKALLYKLPARQRIPDPCLSDDNLSHLCRSIALSSYKRQVYFGGDKYAIYVSLALNLGVLTEDTIIECKRCQRTGSLCQHYEQFCKEWIWDDFDSSGYGIMTDSPGQVREFQRRWCLKSGTDIPTKTGHDSGARYSTLKLQGLFLNPTRRVSFKYYFRANLQMFRVKDNDPDYGSGPQFWLIIPGTGCQQRGITAAFLGHRPSPQMIQQYDVVITPRRAFIVRRRCTMKGKLVAASIGPPAGASEACRTQGQYEFL